MIIEKNMVYNIIFNDEKILNKDLSKISKKNIDNIFVKLEFVSNNWIINSQTKKLNNYYLCDYRLRIWNYRVLYNLNEISNELVVFRILHRSKLY